MFAVRVPLQLASVRRTATRSQVCARIRRQGVRGTMRLSAVYIWSFLLLLLGGFVSLPIPFSGDQALFTIGARMMSEGAVLYRDFWDLKPPGILYFYYVAGTLFGFHEVGIRALEVIYFMTLGVVLIVALARRYENDLVKAIVPALTVGLYYASAESWHLTQVEALVGFPLFLSLWQCVRGVESKGSGTARFFLSGFCGGLVLLFKVLFLPLLATMWLVVLIGPPKGTARLRTTVARAALALSLGLMASVAAAIAIFVHEGTANQAYRTFFEIPWRISGTYYAGDLSVLSIGVQWFLSWSSPLLALTVVAIASGRVLRDPMARGALAWIVAGAGMIALQRGWAYHFVLLLWPLGVVAATGVDVLLTHLKPVWISRSALWRVVAAVSVMTALFAPAAVNLANKVRHAMPLMRSLDEQALHEYQSRMSPWYGAVRGEVEALPLAGQSAMDLYVFGDPLYLYLSHRVQPVPINGWSPEFLLPEQWGELHRSLVETEPEYVFVQDYNDGLIRERYPDLLAWLERRYQIINRGEHGVWYQKRIPQG